VTAAVAAAHLEETAGPAIDTGQRARRCNSGSDAPSFGLSASGLNVMR